MLLKHQYETYFYSNRRRNLFKGIYSNFSDAIGDIPRNITLGYNNTDSSDMYQKFMNAIRECDYPVLFWLERILPGCTRIFDYGGHVGFLYYTFNRYITLNKHATWTVFDVPEVVRQGKAIAERNQTTQLNFTESCKDGDGCDIMLVSGSQQYIDTPLHTLLKQYGQLPKHLIINMIPLHERHEFVTLNHIGTAVCPYRVDHKESFVNSLTSMGWKLEDSWKNESKSCHIPFHDEYNGTLYHGFYFTR